MGCNCRKKKRIQQASVTSPTPEQRQQPPRTGRAAWYPEPEATKTPASR